MPRRLVAPYQATTHGPVGSDITPSITGRRSTSASTWMTGIRIALGRAPVKSGSASVRREAVTGPGREPPDVGISPRVVGSDMFDLVSLWRDLRFAWH